MFDIAACKKRDMCLENIQKGVTSLGVRKRDGKNNTLVLAQILICFSAITVYLRNRLLIDYLAYSRPWSQTFLHREK